MFHQEFHVHHSLIQTLLNWNNLGVGERIQHEVISHTLLRITADEMHERIVGILASSSPFSFFLLSLKGLTYFLNVKIDWDQLRPQLITLQTKMIINLGKD